MKIVACQSGDFARDKGRQVAETLLQAHPDATAIYAHNDEMAIGAIAALEAAGKMPGKDVIIVSIDGTRDALQAIIDGKMGATVECNPCFGPKAFDTVERYAKGEKHPAVDRERGPLLRRLQCEGTSCGRLLRQAGGQPSHAGAPSPRLTQSSWIPRDERLPAPLLDNARHRQALRRHSGACAGAVSRSAHGRGPCADRPERCRQVDDDQDPDRRLHARTPARSASTASRSSFTSPQEAQRNGHQHDLPGDQPRPLPLGDREHLPRPQNLPLRACSTGRPCTARPARCSRASTSTSTCAGRSMDLFHRRPADGRDRPRGRFPGEARHHGRADLLARRARGRRAVRRHPPAQAPRASRSSSSATSSTSSMPSATASPSCATAARSRGRRWPEIGKLELVAAMLGAT